MNINLLSSFENHGQLFFSIAQKQNSFLEQMKYC